MMTISLVMVIVAMVIIMMRGVGISGMKTDDNVRPFFDMNMMKMDKGRDLDKTKNLKNSNKDEYGTMFYELIHC